MNTIANTAIRLRTRLGREFLAYFVISLMALAVDMGILLVLASFIHYTIAASISFVIGSVIHYQLVIRFVFRHRKLQDRKIAEFTIFIIAGIIGLAVNVGVIALCVDVFSLALLAAKLVAAGGSFVSGYVVRKVALF